MVSGRRCALGLALAVAASAAGCRSNVAEQALTLSEESLALRQLQTRRFDTKDELLLLDACSGVLQDLGFTLDESDTSVGLLAASKSASAVETEQVVMTFVAAGFMVPLSYDARQIFRATVVTHPVGKSGTSTAVRVTFQRSVWDSNGKMRTEHLEQPTVYETFFDLLAKSVFLEAHQEISP